MNILSKIGLTIFEIANELFLAVGAGVFGVPLLLSEGIKSKNIVRCVILVGMSSGTIYYICRSRNRIRPSKKRVVFVTGCDSGLGYSLIEHVSNLGFTVVAGFLNLESEGAKETSASPNIYQVQLDITKPESITKAVENLEELLDSNPKYELYAVVNNAGVMVFGEFEWLTDRLIDYQIQVNLLGTLKLTRKVLYLLRKFGGRLIFITSHCAQACLPGLAVYGSTKSGISSFCEGLRVEISKYGVNVINFIPGSFVTQSNIMAHHAEHVKEMEAVMTPEQKNFYGNYFKRYHSFLMQLKAPSTPIKLKNEQLYEKFEEALMCVQPKSCYKVEPFRYAFFHFLFKISPAVIRDYFVEKFVKLPKYLPNEDIFD